MVQEKVGVKNRERYQRKKNKNNIKLLLEQVVGEIFIQKAFVAVN